MTKCTTCRKDLHFLTVYGNLREITRNYCWKCWCDRLIREAELKGVTVEIKYWKKQKKRKDK